MHVVECLTHSELGGGQAVVCMLVNLLKRFHPELNLTVILPPGGSYVDRFRKLDVRVVEFPFDRISLISIFRTYLLLRTLKPDVIHSHGKGAGFYARLFPRFLMRAKRIHMHHGFHPPEQTFPRRMYILLEKYLLRQGEYVITVSESETKGVGGVFPSAKIKTIPNIVDRDEIRESSRGELSGDVENFLSRNKKSFVVTMIGRNDPVKNYPLAFESCKMLLERGKDFAFIFVGIDGEDGEFKRLMSLYPRSIFGIPFSDNTNALVHRSNVILLTSKKEGSPLTVLEAFSLGKPVVGTNVDGIRDLVTHGHNGLLCEQSAPSIAEALEEIAADEHLYRKLSQNASQTAAHMDKKVWTENYYRLYLS